MTFFHSIKLLLCHGFYLFRYHGFDDLQDFEYNKSTFFFNLPWVQNILILYTILSTLLTNELFQVIWDGETRQTALVYNTSRRFRHPKDGACLANRPSKWGVLSGRAGDESVRR